eukprot:751488-Hanusia_phi.AAC.6
MSTGSYGRGEECLFLPPRSALTVPSSSPPPLLPSSPPLLAISRYGDMDLSTRKCSKRGAREVRDGQQRPGAARGQDKREGRGGKEKEDRKRRRGRGGEGEEERERRRGRGGERGRGGIERAGGGNGREI